MELRNKDTGEVCTCKICTSQDDKNIWTGKQENKRKTRNVDAIQQNKSDQFLDFPV